MDSWLVALIVIIFIIILVLIIFAVSPSRPVAQSAPRSIDEKENVGLDARKQYSANLTIAFINLSNQTSNFLQQIRSSYKGITETFRDMNNMSNYIGHNLNAINSKHGKDFSYLLCEKNALYKDLAQEILVSRNTIKSNDYILGELNRINIMMAEILIDICPANDKNKYVKLLHGYDIEIVGQMGALVNNDYKKYIDHCRTAQKNYLTLSMTMSYCRDNLE